ncbi:CHAT domain-containing protein [Solwaraspora sp. WMMB335]|uniref:CHAT domain-containing protein n=1 Tax=Solwaraspora sp. WMMB335 TaxID=3404118 RepID=UPI003B94E42B
MIGSGGFGDTVHGDKFTGDKIGGDKFGGDKIMGDVIGRDKVSFRAHRPVDPRVILIMSANPRGTSALRLADEVREISAAVTRAQARDRVAVHTAAALRLDDLQQSLQQHRPALVHFSGHGTESDGLLVNDEFGLRQPVPPQALSRLFGILHDSLRCVVLSACSTYQQARAVAEHVPCVIGMRGAVPDDTAVRFATGFYEAIAFGQSVRAAFELGCNRIELHGHDDAGIPALLSDPGVAEQTFIVE